MLVPPVESSGPESTPSRHVHVGISESGLLAIPTTAIYLSSPTERHEEEQHETTKDRRRDNS